MKDAVSVAAGFLKELEAEVPASRKCLERIPPALFEWKPHEKSMRMGYLALLIAEIPKSIRLTIEDGVIDFATFTHFQPRTTAELVAHFDENTEGAQKALRKATDKDLETQFRLQRQGQVLLSMRKVDSVGSTLNHWVHHRSQLTVYMRLNNIAVPSIYGPSADESVF